MKPECHHPPFVLHLTPDLRLTASMVERLDAAVANMGRNPQRVMATMGEATHVEVVECSWCRNPGAGLSDEANDLLRAHGLLGAADADERPVVTVAVAATRKHDRYAWAIADSGVLCWGGAIDGQLDMQALVHAAVTTASIPVSHTIDVHYDPWRWTDPDDVRLASGHDVHLYELPVSRSLHARADDAALAMLAADSMLRRDPSPAFARDVSDPRD